MDQNSIERLRYLQRLESAENLQRKRQHQYVKKMILDQQRYKSEKGLRNMEAIYQSGIMKQ